MEDIHIAVLMAAAVWDEPCPSPKRGRSLLMYGLIIVTVSIVCAGCGGTKSADASTADVDKHGRALPTPLPTPTAPKFSACRSAPEDMACVPGGEFVRGVDSDEHACRQTGNPKDKRPATIPSAKVTVATFYMDLYEVTNADYRACAATGKCRVSGPNYLDFKADEQPITGVSWFDARDYCLAVGKHLPTEAEWEKGARGPDGAVNPWGNGPADCEKAVIRDKRGRSCGIKRNGPTPETGRVFEVGSRPAGVYGLFEMVGNAEEWVADWWTTDWAQCGQDCAGENPKGPCDGADDCDGYRYKSVRGGSWYWPTEHATGWHRRRHYPANEPFHHYGFRCAASVEEAASMLGLD